MTLEEATGEIKRMADLHGGKLKATTKFVLDGDTIFLDDTVSPTAVTNDDGDAECTIKMSLENFQKMMSGSLNPMMALMAGKMKIEGDKGVAMKLSGMF
ncbi:MAG: SCP2 sterol-binding domain-containing protein [Bacteroidota bacterium]